MRAPLVTALLGGGSWLFTSLAATPLPAAVSSESDASRLLSADCAQCDVRILEVVHAARLFADDPKQFVDRPSRVPRAALLEETLLLRANGTSAEAVRRFVQQRFLSVGSDMLPASLPESETAPVPSWIARMQGMPAGEWTSWMRNEWSVLGRKYTVPEGACKDIGCVSFLPPPSAATGETFMVPGGRFRESYYWDTYWTVLGLLSSGFRDLARDAISNLVRMQKEYGHVPNGSRAYYLSRSQPPLLASMVCVYARSVLMDEFSRAQTSKSDEGAEGRSAARARIAREMEFLETAMDAVWHELSEFWDVERSVSVISSASSESAHILSRYGPHDPQGEWRTPRPESFPQDVSATESLFATTSEREEAYAHIRAAAESGWDFSSRWIRSPARGIADSKTRDILPVDLNSFLYIAWIAVHDTYHHLLRLEVEHDRTVDAEKPGKAEDERSKSKRRKSLEWKDRARDARRLARRRMQGMVDILYDQSTGLFTDMDLVGIAGADAYRAKRATCDAPSLPSPFPVCDADESRPRRPLDLPVHAGMLVPLLLSSCETDIHPYATGSPARARGMRALAPLLFDSPGGVPVSLVETEGQTQWDWPNAWAPTSFFALLSLASPSSSPSDTSDLDSDFASTSSCATPFLRPFDLAAPNPAEIRLARKVIMPMFCLWTKTHGMYEKYRADKRWSETPGGGGEYGVQTGFGWTNGIAMWAMERYGLLLDLGGCGEQEHESHVSTNAYNEDPEATLGGDPMRTFVFLSVAGMLSMLSLSGFARR